MGHLFIKLAELAFGLLWVLAVLVILSVPVLLGRYAWRAIRR